MKFKEDSRCRQANREAFIPLEMYTQVIGGTRLFQLVTGYLHIVGFIVFGITVAIYAAVDGFWAVVITDTIQGCVVVCAVIALLFAMANIVGNRSCVP